MPLLLAVVTSACAKLARSCRMKGGGFSRGGGGLRRRVSNRRFTDAFCPERFLVASQPELCQR